MSTFSIVLIFITSHSKAQDSTFVKAVRQRDLIDVIFPKKERKTGIDTLAPKNLELGIFPYVGFGPATGLEIGVSGSAAFFTADRRYTRQSRAGLSASFTLKKQLFITARSIIFSNKNKWLFVGDQRYNKNTQSTFGLGTTSIEDEETPLKYKFLRLSETAFFHLGGYFYGGLGIHYDKYYNVEIDPESDQSPVDNPYIDYTTRYNFNPTESAGSGISANLLYDTRDNLFNTYKGLFLLANYRVYREGLGSTTDWQELRFELRNFHSLASNNRQILALWIYSDFIIGGNAPYMHLPAVGWDSFNNTGRGYIQGRFRGPSLIYSELEYRYAISGNGLVGGVAFVNASSVSNPDTDLNLFQNIAPAGGIGLRIKLNKETRTNLRLDFAVGRQSTGVYLNISEAF
ncbi:BamA/TamA family outer membrane protein [Solitalea canadensis]|uniref:hypothetical protein n=1 Tax=Solitalea canadensis TaxID=995 RepID=UPI0012F9A058|nr:hypothetical protein [Solitalea canadensis]